MPYDATLPTDRDYVRFVLGDTETVELLTDATIAAVLAMKARDAAIAFLAQGLAARFAQLPTTITTSGDSLTWAKRVDYWLSLAANGGVVPGGGAFSVNPPRNDGYSQAAARDV
jgi:hypothetical protein